MDRTPDHHAKDLRGNDYLLRFRGSMLTILPRSGGTPAALSRESFAANATILDGLLSRRTVLIPGAGSRVSLRLHPDAFQALRAWIQPSRNQALARALRRITVWQVLLGVLFLSSAGPWLDAAGQWDTPMAALGALALSVGVLSVAWPRRWIYVLEMVWSVALSAVVTSWVAAGTSSAIWLLVSALLMFEAYGYGRLFMFWCPTAPLPEPGAGSDDDLGDPPRSMFDQPPK